jgi:predicted TIM-barrel fold metal-dependent hydrolase
MRTGHALLLPILGCHVLWGQAALRGLVDAHVHYNGDKAFLEKMALRLDPFDGTAFILTQPTEIPDVLAAMKQHPKRFIGLGSIRLDDPLAVSLVDKFHDAGFRGLGELTGPLKSYDDKSYTAIYERAEKYGMIVLFHNDIVMQPDPATTTITSVYRMRGTDIAKLPAPSPTIIT